MQMMFLGKPVRMFAITRRPIQFMSIICAMFAMVTPPRSYGQTPDLAPPYGDCSLAYWSSNRNLDDRRGVSSTLCLANWRLALGETSRLSFNARAQYSDNKSGGQVREAYLDQEFGAVSLRMGRQIIAWGRADRINPSDVLSPRDFRLLSSEDDDQRDGINAVKLRYTIAPELSATLVAAQFQAHQVPQGSLPINIVKAAKPHRAEWAAKLDHAGSGIDWSVFLFDGYDRNTRYRLTFLGAAAPILLGDYERVKAVGGDIASASGPWTLRAEFSHSQLSIKCGECPENKRVVTRLVAGVDRDVIGTLNINLQFFGIQRTGKQSIVTTQIPLAVNEGLNRINEGLNRINREFAHIETGVAIRVSDRILNEKLKWEFSVTHDFTGHSTLLRPRLSYAINDQIIVSLGADKYVGRQQTYFGSLAKNSSQYLSINVAF